MTEAVIVEAVRTAIGRRSGKLSPVRPDDLLALTLREVVTRAGVDPAQVDDVVVGCVTQTGEQGMNIGRAAVLIAGFPVEVPGTTINRFCGSGQQAVNFAAQGVLSGAQDIVIGAGVENMSRVPMGSDAFGPGEGPVSMMVGSEPTIAWATMRARGLRPSCFAFSAVITSTAAAPSEIWLELPAVTTPSSWNDGFNCDIFSREGGMRTPSSI